jgi:type II secretory ATPase GspE/PulE/Tfp pilus assembly ATPase PilB-like protein
MGHEDTLNVQQDELHYDKKLYDVINAMNAAKGFDGIFNLYNEIIDLVEAERMSMYVLDYEKKELYTRVPARIDVVGEIRLPLNEKSIAGYVALTHKSVNLVNAYDQAELARISPSLVFDGSWDKKTGFRTRQLLTVPIRHGESLVGVFQLLNKKHGERFTEEDEERANLIAKPLGIAFLNHILLTQKQRTKFGYILAQNRITQEELNAAITEARKRKIDTESILMDQYKVSKADIGASLSAFYGCSFIEFDPKCTLPSDVIKNLRLEYLSKNFWVPIQHEGDTVVVLVDDPYALHKCDIIKGLLPKLNVQFAVGVRADILRYINSSVTQTQNKDSKDSIGDIIGDLKTEEVEEKEDDATTKVNENDSTVMRLANQVIIDACKKGASDIHIEPYGGRADTLIRFRIDGSCVEYQKVPPVYRRPLIGRLKIMAKLNIAERRLPQDGKIRFRLQDREIELRVSIMPTARGDEDVVLRVLASSEPIPIEQLGMNDRNLKEMKNIIQKPYGLILCVGPTGSGKTTTLHSVLGYINKPDKKIWTAEDPVEITQRGLRQVQVQPKIGLTFGAALRGFLRLDPDVIMVGEMRDRETAAISVEASITGHLVFSTLHTNTAVETVVRLLDMDLDPFTFADAMLGILAQRLVKKVCQECKAPYHPSRDQYDELARHYGEEGFEKLGVPYDEAFVLYRGKGCTVCNNTGYRGRIGIHELLITSDEIKKLIQARARPAELLVVAKEEGLTTLVQDGILKVLKGVTDIKQIQAVAIH